MNMSKRASSFIAAVIVCLFVITLLQPFGSLGALAQPDCATFKETGKTVCARFLKYWQERGGLAQQGFPISAEMQEQSDTDGKTYTVQYFERAVFEYHPENKPPYDVLLSLLGNFEYRRKYPGGAPNQQPNNSAGSVLFKETGKRLGGIFLDYWKSHGGLAQQGYPISDEFMEVSDLNGKTYRVQYFERAVFEYHPEEKPEYQVLLSQLGTFRYRDLYAGVRFPEGAGEITIWHSYTGDSLQTLQKSIQMLSNNNKNFKVNLVAVPRDQLRQRFITDSARGAGPDLMLGLSEWIGELSDAGSITPVDSIEAVNSLLGELQPVAVNTSRYNGKVYGVPVNIKTMALIYNKSIVNRTFANTEDMLSEAARLVRDNVRYGLAINMDFNHTAGYNFAYGGKLFVNPTRVDFNTQGTIDWLTWLKRVKDATGTLAKRGGSAEQEINDLFKAGSIAMLINDLEALRQFEKALGKDKVGVSVAPGTPSGGRFAPFVATDDYFMSATARNTRAAADFLKYITSPPVQRRFLTEAGHLVPSRQVDLSRNASVAKFAEGSGLASTFEMQTADQGLGDVALTGFAASFKPGASYATAAESNFSAFMAQANQGTSLPNFAGTSKVWGPADNMIGDVIEGRLSPQEAARNATDTINTALGSPGTTATPTSTPGPEATPEPESTSRVRATNTPVPRPTNTPVPRPTDTPIPRATNTQPRSTDTPVPRPTDTPVLRPTSTTQPRPTNTPVPRPTNTQPIPPLLPAPLGTN
jgi:maltose-binding protein MalE